MCLSDLSIANVKLWRDLHPGGGVCEAGPAGRDGLVLLCAVGMEQEDHIRKGVGRNGLVYGHGWDCSDSEDSMAGYVAAMDYFADHTSAVY